jgi:hypothetical protein
MYAFVNFREAADAAKAALAVQVRGLLCVRVVCRAECMSQVTVSWGLCICVMHDAAGFQSYALRCNVHEAINRTIQQDGNPYQQQQQQTAASHCTRRVLAGYLHASCVQTC